MKQKIKTIISITAILISIYSLVLDYQQNKKIKELIRRPEYIINLGRLDSNYVTLIDTIR
jgi:hypothetical protein